MGATFGGFSLYVQDGRLQYVHNFVARREDHLAADVRVQVAADVGLRGRLDIAPGENLGAPRPDVDEPLLQPVVQAGLAENLLGRDRAVVRRGRVGFVVGRGQGRGDAADLFQSLQALDHVWLPQGVKRVV
jgi:hypothetical protein